MSSINETNGNYINLFRGLTVGGIALAWHCIQPASALGYLATITTGVFGTAITYGLSRALQQSCKKRCHRVVQPLNLSTKLTKYEKELNRAFQRVQSHPAYALLVEKENFNDANEALSFFKQSLLKGVCYGETIELLRVMKEHPELSCEALLQSADIESIFFNQMLHQIHGSLEAHILTLKMQNNLTGLFKHLNLSSVSEKNNPKIAQLQEAISNLGTQFNSFSHRSDTFEVGQSLDIYQKHMENLLQSNHSQNGIGQVSIMTSNTYKVGKTNYIAGHSILFQYAEGRYRFYDPINSFEGFYEYPDKQSFFEALKKQIIGNLGKNTQIQFAI